MVNLCSDLLNLSDKAPKTSADTVPTTTKTGPARIWYSIPWPL